MLGRFTQSRPKIQSLALLRLWATLEGGGGTGKCFILRFNHSCITIGIRESRRLGGWSLWAGGEHKHYVAESYFFL